MRKLAFVIPVLDDWASFAALITEIDIQLRPSDIMVDIFAVDDGSLTPFSIENLKLPSGSCIGRIEIIRLALNLGHQRAIAVGLCAISNCESFDAVIVMDSDGEDRPSDIPALLAASRERPDRIVLAARAKRSETLSFKFWYRIYKTLFFLLTGQAISFGNFSLMPAPAIRRLVYMPELWNNLAASIIRSRLPYTTIPTERGVRFEGQSRMKLSSLIIHGLSALSVQTDVIFIRMLLAGFFIALPAGLGILAVIGIRLGTDLAVPGWATTAVGALLIILLQSLAVLVFVSLAMLAGRSARPMIPICDSQVFIAGRENYILGDASVERKYSGFRP
jgi:polyisoprenyl-phosphate glycosyltransferase